MKFLECKVPPALLFAISTGLMWVTFKYLKSFSFSHPILPWIAKALFSIGILIGIAGVWEFWKKKTTVDPHRPEKASSFVNSGIYQFTRNPMYLGLLIGLIGILFFFANPINILLVIGFILYMNRFQIIPEERAMTKKFGEDFLDYKESVRRWI
ncbi:MAG: isoprenylcysteine carboxylmethyltransferase family protein [Balneolaceae bacterium]|nr:isoprenylcysteine carboxylmethyltransferase family protein [Balneolaceae bacterium]